MTKPLVSVLDVVYQPGNQHLVALHQAHQGRPFGRDLSAQISKILLKALMLAPVALEIGVSRALHEHFLFLEMVLGI